MCIYFSFFCFLKGKIQSLENEDDDDDDISHGFYSQRSHTFMQWKQNDGLTNNPPNNPYTWTNERMDVKKQKQNQKL